MRKEVETREDELIGKFKQIKADKTLDKIAENIVRLADEYAVAVEKHNAVLTEFRQSVYEIKRGEKEKYLRRLSSDPSGLVYCDTDYIKMEHDWLGSLKRIFENAAQQAQAEKSQREAQKRREEQLKLQAENEAAVRGH